MINHTANIIFAGISSVAILLQIIEPTMQDFLNLEKIGTVGLLVAAVWYFKTELSKAKKEFDVAIKEKDAIIADLHKQILEILKAKINE
ncbi:MAG: hypothetical protein QXW79_04210 [Thermoplasmata archaeon]